MMTSMTKSGLFVGAAFGRRDRSWRTGERTRTPRGSAAPIDPSKAGDQTLTVWWLGNQEVPGIEDWMAESVAAYQKLISRTSR